MVLAVLTKVLLNILLVSFESFKIIILTVEYINTRKNRSTLMHISHIPVGLLLLVKFVVELS